MKILYSLSICLCYIQAVERRGEMIVRILEPHSIGGKQAVDAAHKLLAKKDNRHIVQVIY